MAKTTKSGSYSGQNNSYNNYVPNDRVGMVNDDDRSFLLVVIVIFMVVILLFIPLFAWMYIDIKMMEIRVNKAIVRIEGK